MRRRPILLAVPVLALALFGLPQAAHATTVTPPTSDPFYAQPPDLGATAPGTVLASRPVPVPAALATVSSSAYQLSYRTTAPGGIPVATVTTLLLPMHPASGTRDLVSYQTAEDSLTLDCSPSYTLQTGANDETIDMFPLLASGWDVVVPDYEGPYSEYAVGTMEGPATLDSIRAVEHFAPAGLDGSATPVGLEGYSGGSIPSTWANALQPSYAPELHLVAATAGGLAPDPGQVVIANDGGLAFGEIIAAGVGIDRAYPQFDLDGLLNAAGQALEQKVATDAGGCGSGITSAPFGHVSTYTEYPSAQALLAVPRVAAIIAKLDLITQPAPVGNPTFYFQEIFDEFVPSAPVGQFNAAYCAAGVPIDYVQGITGEHLIGAVDYVPRADLYLASRFAGQPAPDTCPTGTYG